MTAIIQLGKFERVSLKDAWPSEDTNFTPWLAQPSNIALLGAALNMDLEVAAVEHWVGPFRADILARAVDEVGDAEHHVIIENQFGRTNHGHLGQVLTYLAGIESAKTVVWIAERIQPDHRAAIDWLNTNTGEDFSFFAVEVELWRIEHSLPAPRFNVVASPNDWTKSVRKASGNEGGGGLSELRQLRLSYWLAFAEYLEGNKSIFQVKRSRTGPACQFTTGKSGCVISARVDIEKQRVGVALVIYKSDKTIFRALHAQKDAIEREVGEALDWQEMPGYKRARIALSKSGMKPADSSQWPEQHAWMLGTLERFRSAFVPRLKSLPPGLPTEAEDDDEAPED